MTFITGVSNLGNQNGKIYAQENSQGRRRKKYFRETFKHYADTKGGFKRFIKELEALNGKDYVYAFLAAIEYVEPKFGRVDVDGRGISDNNYTVNIIDFKNHETLNGASAAVIGPESAAIEGQSASIVTDGDVQEVGRDSTPSQNAGESDRQGGSDGGPQPDPGSTEVSGASGAGGTVPSTQQVIL